MLVPSFDNFSDVRLSILFVTGKYTPAAQFYRPGGSGNWEKIVAIPQFKYALFTFLPVFISFLFTIRHWYHTENSKRKKLRSLPFLILQIWPQYRVGRILYYFRKGNRKWIREKNYFETELSTLGMFEMFVYLHCLTINLSQFFENFYDVSLSDFWDHLVKSLAGAGLLLTVLGQVRKRHN